MHQAICLNMTHISSTNVNTLDDSAALNKSPVDCATPKGPSQSMKKENGDGLDYLTVEHNQITFCFAHLDPCYRRSILYAVERRDIHHETRLCSFSVGTCIETNFS